MGRDEMTVDKRSDLIKRLEVVAKICDAAGWVGSANDCREAVTALAAPPAPAPPPATGWTREQVEGQINQELCGYYREDTVEMLRAYADSLPASAVPGKARQRTCPTCASPSPELHPSMQFEGEVQPCADAWHRPGDHPSHYKPSAVPGKDAR